MKKGKNNVKGKEIFAMVFLAIVFFSLMFLSTSQTNQVVEYTYLDEVKETQFNQLQLGEVLIRNEGLFPTKVFLKTFVLCDDSSTDPYSRQLYVNYASKEVSNQNIDLFEDYHSQSLEIANGEERVLALTTYPLFDKSNNETTTKDLSLYEVRSGDDYSYCQNPDQDDLVKQFTIVLENEQ